MNTRPGSRVRLTMVSLLVLALGAAVLLPAGTAQAKPKTDAQIFHDEMRRLWEDHITWTRLVIISLANDLPDTETTVGRLLQNQGDIGNAVKPFYGEAAGEQLSALLADHILIAADVLLAARAGDTAAFDEALARWYGNADDIAAFLNAANPESWPLEEMRMMMREHLDLTLQEAGTYLGGEYDASIAAYDEVHIQALHMADMLSEGIIRQFPSRFN